MKPQCCPPVLKNTTSFNMKHGARKENNGITKIAWVYLCNITERTETQNYWHKTKKTLGIQTTEYTAGASKII